MAFSFFDTPQLKSQRRAAVSAFALRATAERDACIEISLLGNRHSHGLRLFDANSMRPANDCAMGKLRAALDIAKAAMDRTDDMSSLVSMNNAVLSMRAKTSFDYEKLESLELDHCNTLIAVSDDARVKGSALGLACLEFQATLMAETLLA